MIFNGYNLARAGDTAQGRLGQYVVGVTVAGASRHNLDATPFDLVAGDVQIIRPNTAQRWVATGRWECWYCVFDPRPGWRAWLGYPWSEGHHKMSLIDSPHWKRVVARMREAAAWEESAHTHREEFQRNALEEVLLHCHAWQGATASDQDERVGEAVQYIAEHLAEPMDLVLIAEAVGVSRSRLAELFSQEMGMGVMQWVEQQRMHRACQLLRYSSHNVAGVAREVGYPDAKYFSKRFRAAIGKPPRDWRHDVRQDS